MNLGECYWTAPDMLRLPPPDMAGAWMLPMAVPLFELWQREIDRRLRRRVAR